MLSCMPRFASFILSAMLGVLIVPAFGQPALPPVHTITFSAGSPLTTVSGQMVPGCCDLYAVPAKAGQTLLVSIAAEGEVTFRVYAPDTTVSKTADGKPQIEGRTLPNAGADDSAKAWVGALPRSGTYLIAVSMVDTGPALSPYSLTVSLQ
jgi:hypothetical protein